MKMSFDRNTSLKKKGGFFLENSIGCVWHVNYNEHSHNYARTTQSCQKILNGIVRSEPARCIFVGPMRAHRQADISPASSQDRQLLILTMLPIYNCDGYMSVVRSSQDKLLVTT